MDTLNEMLYKQGWSSLAERNAHEAFLDSNPELKVGFELMADQLANNDSSSDEELKIFFVECGINISIAEEAIGLRSEFLMNPFAELCYREGKLGIRSLRVGCS